MKIFIQAIETKVPAFIYDREFSLQASLKLMGSSEAKRSFLEKIYAGSAIDKRHSVIPDWRLIGDERILFSAAENMLPEPDTKKRNDLFIRNSNKLACSALSGLLEKLHKVNRKEITHLITVSCTGFGAPGFDLEMIKTLGLRTSMQRYHLGFMGCYAAFPAMRLAKQIVGAEPKAKVAVVIVELCTLHFKQRFDPDTQVANAIFADGAAAALISADERDSAESKIELKHFSTRLIPSTEDEMTWAVGNEGFDMKLSSYVPQAIALNAKEIVSGVSDEAGIKIEKLKNWAIHPGGRAILDKFSEVMSVDKAELISSYETLREYGNMSSATILFVLKHMMERKAEGLTYSAAFGPGLTVESAILNLCG